MATPTTTQQAEATPPKFAKLKRILLIVLIALVAAGAAAGGMYFYLSKHGSSKPPAPPPPVFFPLDPMTVNLLSDDDGQHYLRVGVTLKIADEKMQTRITEHMPELRSRILLNLSNKHPEDLATVDGKRALADELKTVLEQPTEAGAPPLKIEDVLFTEFVVQ